VQAQNHGDAATAKANAVRAEAQANAEPPAERRSQASTSRITGECRSRRHRGGAQGAGTNPNLVTLVQAERWNGVLPTTMVPGSAVPFVSIQVRHRICQIATIPGH